MADFSPTWRQAQNNSTWIYRIFLSLRRSHWRVVYICLIVCCIQFKEHGDGHSTPQCVQKRWQQRENLINGQDTTIWAGRQRHRQRSEARTAPGMGQQSPVPPGCHRLCGWLRKCLAISMALPEERRRYGDTQFIFLLPVFYRSWFWFKSVVMRRNIHVSGNRASQRL